VAEIAGVLKAQPGELRSGEGAVDERKALEAEVAQLRRDLAMAGGSGGGAAAAPKDRGRRAVPRPGA
jgi:alanyl-tRNA synthetase